MIIDLLGGKILKTMKIIFIHFFNSISHVPTMCQALCWILCV